MGWEGQALGQVQGTATYRERLALLPDAVFEATLKMSQRWMPRPKCLARPVSNGPAILRSGSKSLTILHASIRATVAQCGLASWLAGAVLQHRPALPSAHRGAGQRGGAAVAPGGLLGPGWWRCWALGDSARATLSAICPVPIAPAFAISWSCFRPSFLPADDLPRQGADASFDDIGSWTVASDRRTLVLSGGREAPLKFAIKDANTLRQLDLEGREIALVAQRFEQDAGPAATGTAADARDAKYWPMLCRFTECLTRQNRPVAQVPRTTQLWNPPMPRPGASQVRTCS